MRCGSGFSAMTGWPFRYLAVLTTRPSWPKTTITSEVAKVNVGKKRLINPVDPQAVGDGLVEGGDRGMIGVVSGLIAREVSPHMLDVETGLIAGIERLIRSSSAVFRLITTSLSRLAMRHSLLAGGRGRLCAAVKEGRGD